MSVSSPPASAAVPAVEPLGIAGRTFHSRLILGTGKYRDAETMVAALAASGTEVVTVALRRVNLDELGKGSLIDRIDPKRYLLLPNTATRRDLDDPMTITIVREAVADSPELLDLLHASDGRTLNDLCEHLDMTRQGVTQHLGLLEAANLVASVRRGREKLHFLNPVPLQEIYERWIAKFEKPRLKALSELKQRLEKTHG